MNNYTKKVSADIIKNCHNLIQKQILKLNGI
jgi:hypothetical protein